VVCWGLRELEGRCFGWPVVCRRLARIAVLFADISSVQCDSQYIQDLPSQCSACATGYTVNDDGLCASEYRPPRVTHVIHHKAAAGLDINFLNHLFVGHERLKLVARKRFVLAHCIK
jgi:hypothetical protein